MKDKACLSKQSYDTEWEATTAAAWRRDESTHPNIHPYKCQFCEHWHIGHNNRQVFESVDCKLCKKSIAKKHWQYHMNKWHSV